MPIITVDGDRDWAVPMLPGNVLDPKASYAPEHRLTFALGAQLRLYMPSIFKGMGRELTESSVGVTFPSPHHTINMSNIWVLVSPTIEERLSGDANGYDTQVFLDLVRDAVRQFFSRRRRVDVPLKPTVDIDIAYFVGAGLSLDTNQVEVARW